MLITFSGFRGKKKLKLLEDAVCFYAVKLMGTRLAVNLEINITSKKIDGNTLGFCTYEDDNVKPRNFEIEISNKIKCVEELFKTVAHEMVHVKQFIRKQYPSEREAKKLEFELYAKCFPWNLVT